jgi:hypothetical protein
MMFIAIADLAWTACWVVLYLSLVASLLAFLLLGVYGLFCWLRKEINGR